MPGFDSEYGKTVFFLCLVQKYGRYMPNQSEKTQSCYGSNFRPWQPEDTQPVAQMVSVGTIACVSSPTRRVRWQRNKISSQTTALREKRSFFCVIFHARYAIQNEINLRLITQSFVGYNQVRCSNCTKTDCFSTDRPIDFVEANDVLEKVWDFRIISGKKNRYVVV